MGSSRAAAVLALACISSAVTVAPRARAQSAVEREAARGLMDDGMKLRERGDHRGALERFESADTLMHVPTTGIEVGREHLALGHLVEAHEALAAVAKTTAKPGEPAVFGAARNKAQALAEDLAPRIPTLRITVTGADTSATVTVDGTEVSSTSLGASRKMNPGTHTVVVHSGGQEKREQVVLHERDAKDLAVELAGATRANGATSGSATTSDLASGIGPNDDSASGGSHPTDPGWSTARKLTYGGFIVAGVGGLVGAVTGIASFSFASDARSKCGADGICRTADAKSALESTHTMGNIATVSLVLGAVGLTAGIIGVVIWKSEPSKPAKLAASLSANGASLVGSF